MRVTPITWAATGVFFSSICFGIVPFFTKGLTGAGIAPEAIAFYRYALAALVLAPTIYMARRHWQALAWAMGGGAVMGLGWIGYAIALEQIPVSTAAVIYMTYPVFTLAIAWGLFGERPSARAVAAAGIVLGAATLAAGPEALSPGALVSLLAALIAPISFGLVIAILIHRLAELTPMTRIGATSLGAILGLAPLMLQLEPAAILPQDPSHWRLIFGIGLATALIPQLIYVTCAPRIGSARTAILGCIELPTMMVIGLMAFGEAISPAQLAAAGLIIWAIWLTRAPAPQPATRTT